MMADATDSAPYVPSRVASLRSNQSAPQIHHIPLTKEDSVTGKSTGKKKEGKKREYMKSVKTFY